MPYARWKCATRSGAALREHAVDSVAGWTSHSHLRKCECRASIFRFSGGQGGGAIPDPIPNSEVKPSCADGTAGVTLWESRSSPDLCPQHESAGGFFIGSVRALISAAEADDLGTGHLERAVLIREFDRVAAWLDLDFASGHQRISASVIRIFAIFECGLDVRVGSVD